MAATHRGTCQLCGRAQKLPNGRLSLHGYNMQAGFFSGVCRGARALPFERSIDLIRDEILRATKEIERLTDEQARLLVYPDARTLMWVSTYVKASGKSKSYHQWELVTLEAMPGDYGFFAYAYTNRDGQHVSSRDINGVQDRTLTVEAARLATILKYNTEYAHAMDRTIAQLRSYIAWQRDRCVNWTVAPLLSLDGKTADENAFSPE